MDINIADERVQIFYDEVTRDYYIEVIDHNRITAIQGLCYCPWCATKLPESLSDEYYMSLRSEYGIEWSDIQTDQKNLPVEFKSDEWWKKRGL